MTRNDTTARTAATVEGGAPAMASAGAPAPWSAAGLQDLLRRHVTDPGVAPAAALAVNPAGTTPLFDATAGSVTGTRWPCFDLASVSKPFLAVTVARRVERGDLAWDTPLAALAPDLAGTHAGDQSLEALLSHRAGLEAHIPLWNEDGRAVRRGAALRRAAEARRAGSPDAPLYSDLGYLLVGAALETAFQEPLDDQVAREVVTPLGLGGRIGSARQLLGDDWLARAVVTETVTYRGGPVRGAVHDDNAWALGGHGLPGHAGLFGDAPALARFGRALLEARAGRSSWLTAGTLAHLLAPRPGGTLRLGFDGKSDRGSSASSQADPDTFGHLGFTGTSLWCDPRRDLAVALLTNRVCPTRDNPRLRAARPALHEELFQAFDQQTQQPRPA